MSADGASTWCLVVGSSLLLAIVRTDKYRNSGVSYDVVTDAAQQRASDDIKSSCSHDDEASILRFCHRYDALSWTFKCITPELEPNLPTKFSYFYYFLEVFNLFFLTFLLFFNYDYLIIK